MLPRGNLSEFFIFLVYFRYNAVIKTLSGLKFKKKISSVKYFSIVR